MLTYKYKEKLFKHRNNIKELTIVEKSYIEDKHNLQCPLLVNIFVVNNKKFFFNLYNLSNFIKNKII